MRPQILPLTNSFVSTRSSSPPIQTMVFGSKNDLYSTRLLIDDDDPNKPENKPFLSTSSSRTRSNKKESKFCQLWRGGSSSETSLPSLTAGDSTTSLREDVEHVASETYLISRLSFNLLRFLGVGYRWIARFVALGCYSFLLFPGFLQVGYYYFFSKRVRRGIQYGDQPRNRLDLYMPKNNDGPKPVVAFVTGGAWIIGYKAWGSLLGQQLSDCDVIVACIDYRNFPQGTISDMVKDASQGISFVCNNIAEYGGDPNRIYLMGQSAGAHISACSLIEQAIKESGERESTSWSLSQIRCYFGLSGGYNLLNLVDHFHSRGLYRSLFVSIMEGEESLRRYSPDVIVQDPDMKNIASLLPPVILFHGTADYSIPSDARSELL